MSLRFAGITRGSLPMAPAAVGDWAQRRTQQGSCVDVRAERIRSSRDEHALGAIEILGESKLAMGRGMGVHRAPNR